MTDIDDETAAQTVEERRTTSTKDSISAPSTSTDQRSLGRVDATSVGVLLAAGGTGDIADAHVIICAR